jgi:membrane-bound lytic murein transglycosylase F
VAYESIFSRIATEYGLDRHLLSEQAYRESRYDPYAVGAADDLGLMQILPSTWDEWAPKIGVYDPFDPDSNVRVSAAYQAWIREQLTPLGRTERYWVLVAYNWGIGNVLRLLRSGGHWSDIPSVRQDYAIGIVLAAEANALAILLGAPATVVNG